MAEKNEKALFGKAKVFMLGVLTALTFLVVLGAGPSGNGGQYQIVSSTTGAGRIIVHIVDTSNGKTKVVSNGIRNQYDVPFADMTADGG